MNTHVHSASVGVQSFHINPWTFWLMLQVAFIVAVTMVTLWAMPHDPQSDRERLEIEHTIEERGLWQQLNARQCNLADESVQALQQQLSAYNLNGQLKDLQMRRVTEGTSFYFIGEVGISGAEILVFDIGAVPNGQPSKYSVQFKREFFAD